MLFAYIFLKLSNVHKYVLYIIQLVQIFPLAILGKCRLQRPVKNVLPCQYWFVEALCSPPWKHSRQNERRTSKHIIIFKSFINVLTENRNDSMNQRGQLFPMTEQDPPVFATYFRHRFRRLELLWQTSTN